MWLFRLVPILFMLPLIAYFYFYVVRSLRFWHVAVDQTWKKLLVLVLAALLCFVLHEYLEFGLYYSIALLCCFCGAGPIRAGAEPASPNKESLAPAVSLWFLRRR